MNLPTFQEIAAVTATTERAYAVNEHGSMQIVGRHHPWSITETEFNYIARDVARRGCKRGFEIGTGLGISSLAAAFGMRETGGKIVTMDCFIESQHQDCFAYKNASHTYPETLERQTIQKLVEHFGLQEHLIAAVGISPRDVPTTVRRHFGTHRCDYGFLDGEHRDQALVRDLTAIKPQLARRHALFLHDADAYSERLTSPFRRIPECVPPHGWHLAVCERVR